jgi:peptidyl-prolyl cis-trans isomerase SurA
MDRAMPGIDVTDHLPRRWLAAALLIAAIAIPLPAGAQVVVVANGSPITAYDIDQRTKLIETSQHTRPTRKQVIQDLIDDRLKIAKAKVYGFEITDEQIDRAFASMASRQHISVEQFRGFLARAGISPETIKARVRAELTWNELVRGKFSSSLEISESEIAKAMRAQNAEGSVGYIYTLYPVTVVVPSGSAEAVIAAKKREAEELRDRFANCKNGLALARGLRDVAVREPVTRSSGDLSEQLRELLGKMELGHLTPPEVTNVGVQMFAVCEKKQAKMASPVEREVRDKLFTERFHQESEKFLEEIRKSAMIEYK